MGGVAKRASHVVRLSPPSSAAPASRLWVVAGLPRVAPGGATLGWANGTPLGFGLPYANTVRPPSPRMFVSRGGGEEVGSGGLELKGGQGCYRALRGLPVSGAPRIPGLPLGF